MKFNGAAYDPRFDDARLTKQIGRVYQTMSSNMWLTLREIAALTGDPEASISAQMRHLRKERFGAYIIERQARGDRSQGLWEYRMTGERINQPEQGRLL